MHLHKFCLLKCLGMLLQQLSLKEGDQESGRSLLCKQMNRVVSSTLVSRHFFKRRMFFYFQSYGLTNNWLKVFQKLNFDLDPICSNLLIWLFIFGLSFNKTLNKWFPHNFRYPIIIFKSYWHCVHLSCTLNISKCCCCRVRFYLNLGEQVSFINQNHSFTTTDQSQNFLFGFEAILFTLTLGNSKPCCRWEIFHAAISLFSPDAHCVVLIIHVVCRWSS